MCGPDTRLTRTQWYNVLSLSLSHTWERWFTWHTESPPDLTMWQWWCHHYALGPCGPCGPWMFMSDSVAPLSGREATPPFSQDFLRNVCDPTVSQSVSQSSRLHIRAEHQTDCRVEGGGWVWWMESVSCIIIQYNCGLVVLQASRGASIMLIWWSYSGLMIRPTTTYH